MACFSASGNTPSVNDALHINVIVSANSGKACLTSYVGQLWSSIDSLLGCGVTSPSDKIDAEQFHRYFGEKVAGVRSTTAGAPLPSLETLIN